MNNTESDMTQAAKQSEQEFLNETGESLLQLQASLRQMKNDYVKLDGYFRNMTRRHDQLLELVNVQKISLNDVGLKRQKAEKICADLMTALKELISYQAVKQLRQFDNFPVFEKVDAAIAKAEKQL